MRACVETKLQAVGVAEKSVLICQTTRRDIPEFSFLHSRHRENLNSHNDFLDQLNNQAHRFLKEDPVP